MGAGRPYKFKPEEFEKAWEEYFAWCDANPWYRKEAIKSGELAGKLVDIPIDRPYTEIGFCSFHGLGEKYLAQLADTLKGKEDEVSIQLSNILTRARAKCYAQKFEGAAVGVYNANIIARALGLTDKSETTIIAEQPLFADDDKES